MKKQEQLKNKEKKLENEETYDEDQEQEEKRRKKIIILILLLLVLILVVFTITYSLFDYTKKGETDNTITSGDLEFLYTENTGVGNGIRITNAIPVDDSVGKSYSTENYVFDFKITAKLTENVQVPYEITTRLGKNSTLSSDIIKVYLVEIDGKNEIPASLTINSNGKVKKFNELKDTTLEIGTYEDGSAIKEKTIYNGVAYGANYEQNFRFRMWISSDANFSGVTDENGNTTYPYSGKTFTATVNVYAKTNS